MYKVLAWIFWLILISVSTFAQNTESREADKKTLRFLKEVEWPRAYREQDTALLDRILADEFQMIGSDGEWSNKKEQLKYVATHKPTYESFRFTIHRLDIFENNTAIVSGTGTIRRKDKDGTYDLVYQSSNVLIKRGDQWRAIASHTSGDKIIRTNTK